jgi:hypothetical protein
MSYPGQVIQGWDTGVAAMKKGELAKLVCRWCQAGRVGCVVGEAGSFDQLHDMGHMATAAA